MKAIEELRSKRKKNKTDKGWVFKVSILAFFISFIFSLISELIIPNAVIYISIFLVFIFIFVGIIFDVVGVSIASCDEKVFHSMATKKVKGAKTAIKLINKKEKVSSFCNDVIGDICGVISGSCGLSIAIKLSNILDLNVVIVTLIVTSIISALTIGGKAIGKTAALNNSNEIIYDFAKTINIFVK